MAAPGSLARGFVGRAAAAIAGLGLIVDLAGSVAVADTKPNYPTSPYHGQRNGDGKIIPCRCRFREQSVQLGTMVCMETPFGTVLTRCDLIEGNTSWIPTRTPCVMSASPPPGQLARR